jgi:predicted Zn-dependent peptidase
MEEDIISPSFSYGYSISESFAYNSISGEADDPELVFKRIMEYVEKAKVQGLSMEDFLRCKRVMYADAVRSFDSTESIANNLFAFICEDAELMSYTEIIDSVDFDDVTRLLHKSFDTDSVTLSTVLPIKNSTSKGV